MLPDLVESDCSTGILRGTDQHPCKEQAVSIGEVPGTNQRGSWWLPSAACCQNQGTTRHNASDNRQGHKTGSLGLCDSQNWEQGQFQVFTLGKVFPGCFTPLLHITPPPKHALFTFHSPVFLPLACISFFCRLVSSPTTKAHSGLQSFPQWFWAAHIAGSMVEH